MQQMVHIWLDGFPWIVQSVQIRFQFDIHLYTRIAKQTLYSPPEGKYVISYTI